MPTVAEKRWKPVLTTLQKELKPEARSVRLAPKITVSSGGIYCLYAACEEIFVQSQPDASLPAEPLLVVSMSGWLSQHERSPLKG